MEAMQHQILQLLQLPPNLYRIRNKTIVRNLDSSRDLNSNKLKSQVEEYPMLTHHRSGSMINLKRCSHKTLRLPHLRLLLRETPMALRKVKDLRTMAPPIITSSKITTRMVSSKMPTIILSRIMVPILIRVFRQQATQVATTIMAAHLPHTEANTWLTMATANTITTMATTSKDPKMVLITVCRTMATKSRPMAWVEVTNEMITVVIIKAVAPVITIITTCQDIIKVIRSLCKQVVHPAIMAMV